MHGNFVMRRGTDDDTREPCARTTQRMPPVQLEVLLESTPRPRKRTVRMRVFNFKPLPRPPGDDITTTPRVGRPPDDAA